MEKTISKNRIAWIDALKGFLILLVVFGHINDAGYCQEWIYSFHLPCFFVISGILLSLNKKWQNRSFIDDFKHSIKTLMYPYLTFGLIRIIVFIIEGIGIKRLILDLLLFRGSSTLWYLPTLLIAELLFFVIAKNIKQNKSFFIILAIIVYTGALSFFYAKYFNSFDGTIDNIYKALALLLNAPAGTVFIYFGYYFNEKFLSKHLENKKSKTDVIVFILSVIVFVSGYCFSQLNGKVDMRYAKFNSTLLFYVFGLISSLALVCIFKFVVKRLVVLEFFGRNSLIIMICHMILELIPLSKWVLGYVITLNDSLWCYLLILVAVMLINSAIIYVINKYLKFLIKIPNKK